MAGHNCKRMRFVMLIQPAPPVESGYTNTVWAVCYRPDGTQVLVAVGDRVFIYDAATG